MRAPVKFLIGLALALLVGWAWHGPAGNGEKLAGRIENDLRNLVAQAKLPAIAARIERNPLSRNAVISGTANDLQREGLGSQFGVKDYARATPGIGNVRWDDEPAGFSLPLLAETLAVTALAYALGFGLAALLFNRRRRTSFLD
ncbi:MAG TPA: hypothetical protein VF655_12925 [Allosphingosinicella sp.]|jgi:hypothetical protein